MVTPVRHTNPACTQPETDIQPINKRSERIRGGLLCVWCIMPDNDVIRAQANSVR